MSTNNTSEEYFADRDLFLRYIHDEVNVARLFAELDPISDVHASRCFDIIVNRLYLSKPQEATP